MTFFPFDAFDQRLYSQEKELQESFQPTPEGVVYRLKLVLGFIESGQTELATEELSKMIAAMERFK